MKIKIPILTQMNQATIMKHHHLINRNRIKILKMTQDQKLKSKVKIKNREKSKVKIVPTTKS